MKFEKTKFEAESKPVFLEINTVAPQIGISPEQLEAILATVRALPQERRADLAGEIKELKSVQSESDRQGITERVRSFLAENGVPIAQSLTAAGIFELARVLSQCLS